MRPSRTSYESTWWCCALRALSWSVWLIWLIEFTGQKISVYSHSFYIRLTSTQWCPEAFSTLFWRFRDSLKRFPVRIIFNKAGFQKCLDQKNKLLHQRGILHILTRKWIRVTWSTWISVGEPVAEADKRKDGGLMKLMEGERKIKILFRVWMVEGRAERNRRRMRRNEEWDSELQIWLFNRVGED